MEITMSKMKKCSVCEKEIAKNAKTCPSCGAKQKKPIWTKWWIWTIIIIVIIAIASSGGENESTNSTNSDNQIKQEENIVYEEYTVSQMVDDLSSNAMAAEQKYAGKHLQISGKLEVIDSDGKYISLSPANNDFSLTNVQCNLKNDEQKAYVATLSKGDTITVKVKIKSIGEILGYQADIIEFVK